jgi:glycosyltransferase involved in cell wall biosynthesis
VTKTKLIWHSNAPFTPTGYGNQTGLFCPLLAETYDVACSAFYGLEGAPIRWEGLPILPGLGGEWGESTLIQHAERFFGGQRDGIVVMLSDVWQLEAAKLRGLNLASWCPVDHEPAPSKVVDFFLDSEAVPIAMSRFGERMLGRLDPLYVPHGVDTTVFKPQDRDVVRRGAFPKGAFVIGMVAANKGHPSRKAFSQALLSVCRMMAAHEDVYLYLHTVLDPSVAAGENLPAMLRGLEIPTDRVRIADQYSLLHRPHPPEEMATIYGALDVLLNPSFGEGFGIPIIEAQACGIPAVVTDFTAMPEVAGAGWHVKHHPYWSGLNSWQAIPDIDDIVSALEECHGLPANQRQKLSDGARKHALQYDARRVLKQYWLPALRVCEQRFAARTPVRIPARSKKAAA